MKLTVAKWDEKNGQNTLAKNGLIRVNDNKPEYGSLMLLNTTVALSGGFLNERTKVGFITGEVATLEKMVDTYGLKAGSDFSALVGPHRIVTLEKTESEIGEEKGYREKINPSSGEVLTKNGETIYWKTEIVAEGSDITDKYIQHDTEAVSVALDPAEADFSKPEGKK